MGDANRCDSCGQLFDDHDLEIKPNGNHVWTCKPPTPRVARSVDDLRVGMWVAWRINSPRRWVIGEIMEPENQWVEGMTTLILEEPAPPAADWLVPADTMEALREALADDPDYTPTRRAARAVLDAATEVE